MLICMFFLILWYYVLKALQVETKPNGLRINEDIFLKNYYGKCLMLAADLFAFSQLVSTAFLSPLHTQNLTCYCTFLQNKPEKKPRCCIDYFPPNISRSECLVVVSAIATRQMCTCTGPTAAGSATTATSISTWSRRGRTGIEWWPAWWESGQLSGPKRVSQRPARCFLVEERPVSWTRETWRKF